MNRTVAAVGAVVALLMALGWAELRPFRAFVALCIGCSLLLWAWLADELRDDPTMRWGDRDEAMYRHPSNRGWSE